VADIDAPDSLTYYHGTKVDLQVGDLLAPGYASNYGKRKQASFVYLSATLDAAIWGAELAVGDGKGRIYVVEPTGAFEDDPNLTNKRFPGNPTKSYRSRSALRVVGEVVEWTGHAPERLKEMRDHVEKLTQQGIEAIED
jgi:hypothetical protein